MLKSEPPPRIAPANYTSEKIFDQTETKLSTLHKRLRALLHFISLEYRRIPLAGLLSARRHKLARVEYAAADGMTFHVTSKDIKLGPFHPVSVHRHDSASPLVPIILGLFLGSKLFEDLFHICSITKLGISVPFSG